MEYWYIIVIQCPEFTLEFISGYILYGFGECACSLHYSIVQNSLPTLKLGCVPPIHPSSPPQPLRTTDHFTVSTILPFPECHIVEITQYGTFANWLLSFSNMFKFLHCLHDLTAHFFIVLINSPLSECIAICESIRLLKDILVSSKFWQWWIKMLYTSVGRFLGGHKFSVLLGKYRDTIAGSHEYACCCCLVTQLCQTLCNAWTVPHQVPLSKGFSRQEHLCMLSHFSCVRLCAMLRTVACQAPLSMRFSRQEYWSGLPFSSPGNLPDTGIEPVSPALADWFFTAGPPGKETVKLPLKQLHHFVFLLFHILVSI